MNPLRPVGAGEEGGSDDALPTVLMVDDVPANLATLAGTLAGQGYRLLEAKNGEEALALAREHLPDLMLLDVMMPDMDGFQVLRLIRQDPQLREMPVVLVTALDDKDALLEGFEAGTDDFVSKPYRAVELRARVRGILRLNRYRLLLGERAARQRAEGEAEHLEIRYREIIEDADLMVQMVRPDGSIAFVNEHWLAKMGYALDEVEGLTFKDLVHPDSLDHCNLIFQDLMTGGVTVDIDATFVTKDGKSLEVSGPIVPRIQDGEVVGTHALLRDVTERKALEAQLIQSQKMEQVGRLTAGIAHDFGNTLAVVSMNAAVILKEVSDDSPFKVDAQEIQEAAKDGLALVRDLMSFSRKAKVDASEVDLTSVAEELVEMLRRILPAGITVSFDGGDVPRIITSDTGTIRQMVMNLATNARDAMEGRGTLTLSVDEAPADDIREAGHSGDFIRLSVEDTGSGIPREILPEVFDPFFTTKTPDAGTGLGLAMIKNLIEQQGGFVSAQSALGEGSVFRLHFRPRDAGSEVPSTSPR